MSGTDVKPFVVVAQIFTRSEEKSGEEVKFLKDIAEFESKQAPCGSYLCLVPLEGDKTTMTVFETYDNGEYLQNEHKGSDAYQQLQSHAAKSDTRHKPVEGNIFNPKAGFVQRDHISKISLDDQFFWIAKLTTHPGKRDELLKVIYTHTANVERDEEETLSFLVLESANDDVTIVLFERYTTEKYFRETHFTSKSMQEYREKMQPLLAERVSGGYRAVAGFIDKREALV